MKRLIILLLIVGCAFSEETESLSALTFASVGMALPNTQITMKMGNVKYNKISWFAHFGLGLGTPPDDDLYDKSVKFAEETLGDRKTDELYNYNTFMGGVTYGIQPKTAILFGGGITNLTNYNEYYDSFEILGDDGKWYVEDDDNSKSDISLTAGIIFLNIRFDKSLLPINIAFSITTAPMNYGVSIGWFLPQPD